MIWELFILGAIIIIAFFVFLWPTSTESKTEWELFAEAIEEAKAEIGKEFAPIFRRLVDEISKLME